MALINHARCRELEDIQRSLLQQKTEAENQIARHMENVSNLRGLVHVERNTLSSLEEALNNLKDEAARSGGRIIKRPTVDTAIREALRNIPKVIEEYNRQQDQLRDVEALLRAEDSLLAGARDKLRYVNRKIEENHNYQRRNNCSGLEDNHPRFGAGT